MSRVTLQLILTHDVQCDPGLCGPSHVVVGGDTPPPGTHVTPVQSLYGQRVLHRALLVGDVGLVYDGVVPVPEDAGRRLPASGDTLDSQRVALFEGSDCRPVGQLLASVSQDTRTGRRNCNYISDKNISKKVQEQTGRESC